MKGKNIMTEEMIMSAVNVACFYFPVRKQFGIKGPLLATGLQEYFVPAILKIGLFSTRNFDQIGYQWRPYTGAVLAPAIPKF